MPPGSLGAAGVGPKQCLPRPRLITAGAPSVVNAGAGSAGLRARRFGVRARPSGVGHLPLFLPQFLPLPFAEVGSGCARDVIVA